MSNDQQKAFDKYIKTPLKNVFSTKPAQEPPPDNNTQFVAIDPDDDIPEHTASAQPQPVQATQLPDDAQRQFATFCNAVRQQQDLNFGAHQKFLTQMRQNLIKPEE